MEERGHEPATIALEAAEQATDAPTGDLGSQVAGRNILDVMRLVEHDRW